MVSGSPRIESIQHLAAGEVGEIAGAIALRSGFQHLVFVLGQAKYYRAVSSVTAHSSSSAPTVMKRRAICACGELNVCSTWFPAARELRAFSTSPRVKSERLRAQLRPQAAFSIWYSSWVRRNITKRSLRLRHIAQQVVLQQ